jgi:stress response protein YsnF
MVVNNTEFIKNKSRINDLLEQLRKKLIAFEVISLRGQILGRIRDFILDKSRRLYMVIPQSDTQADSPVYLLSSKFIQKVDTSNRAIFVDINLTDFHQLPLYQSSKDKTTDFSRPSTRVPETQASTTSSADMGSIVKSQSPNDESFSAKKLREGSNQNLTQSEDMPEVVEEQTVPLLEERLLVNRNKRKIGEIVIRKQIETRIVEVPIQSEKLVIEKVGSDSKQPVEVENLSVDQVSHDQSLEGSGHFPTPPATRPSITSSGETQPLRSQSSTKKLEEVDNQSFLESDEATEVVEEEIVRLLEERLLVNRSKWKVGEVLVRKEVESQIVQVPIRREKLIIEQVSPETKQIAEIDLGKGEVTDVDLRKVSSSDTPYTVTGEFLSPKAASHLLEAIALQRQHGCAKVRVELVLDNPELQETYQKMFDRCSKL